MSKITNALRKIFTPAQSTQRSSATSQQRTENRAASSSGTGAKRRLAQLFGGLKSLFTRKHIASRTVAPNVDTTPTRNSGIYATVDSVIPDRASHTATTNVETTPTGGSDTYAPVTPRNERMSFLLMPIVGIALPYEQLNVTENYIQDFANNNISFTNSEGTKQTGDTLNQAPESYSDHLTQFCGGNKEQALQLSAVLTKESLGIMSPVITGKEDSQWLESSFDVSKGEGDKIKVEIKGALIDKNNKQTTVQNITLIVSPRVPRENASSTLDVKTVTFFKTPEESLKPPPLSPRIEPQQDPLLQENIQAPNIKPKGHVLADMARKISSQLESMVRRAPSYQGSNVTKDYIQEFAINNIDFVNSEGKVEPANLERDQTASYSDHLTKFCGGNRDQARRLSAVLTAKSLDIVSLAIAGKTRNKSHAWPEGNFNVSKTADGDIKVKIAGVFLNHITGITTPVKNVEITVFKESGSRALSVEAVDFLQPPPPKPKLPSSTTATQS